MSVELRDKVAFGLAIERLGKSAAQLGDSACMHMLPAIHDVSEAGKQLFKSVSEREAADVVRQLDAFSEAQRLRQENEALRVELSLAYEKIQSLEKTSDKASPPPAPFLKCKCCDTEMAQATLYIDGKWEWPEGMTHECSECGWQGTTRLDGEDVYLEDAEEDLVIDDDSEEEEEDAW